MSNAHGYFMVESFRNGTWQAARMEPLRGINQATRLAVDIERALGVGKVRVVSVNKKGSKSETPNT